MADRYRDFDRERRWRDRERWDQGYDRDWNRGSYGRRFDRSRDMMMHPEYYERDWEEERDRERGLLPRYNRDYDYDRDFDRGYNRGFYNRGYDYDRDRDRDFRRDRYARDYGTDWETGPTWTYTETWWLIPGPFTGIGPRGFQRSDDRIQEDINDRLTQHGRIDALEIQVDVKNGEVTLHGTVNSRREKRMAEDVAETVFGVTDVHNQLRVQQTGMDTGQFGQTGMQGQLREGMDVVGRDGGHIGTVKEVRGNEFLVDRPMARDIFVPFSACNVSGGQVQLNVRANEVDNQGWRTPEVIETPKTR
jgi:hypothetical protein